MRHFRTLAALTLLVCATAPATAYAQDLRSRLESHANRGNGEAAYHLGMIYHLGLGGVPRDARRAFELFRASANAGDPLGAYKLGCYYDGQGQGIVEADPVLALRHKLIAAEAGYALAQQDVARIYIGQGNIEQALRWIHAAARQGDVSSLAMLAALYGGQVPDSPVPRDPVRGYLYNLIAARKLSEGLADGPTVAEMEAEVRRHLALSDRELAQAQEMLATWREEPTPLTLRAAAGQEAAEELARRLGN